MAEITSYPESELMQMWDRSFREDYKRRGYDLESNKSKLPTEKRKEELKKLYGWSK